MTPWWCRWTNPQPVSTQADAKTCCGSSLGFDGDVRPTLAVAALTAGVVAYGAIFTWAGLVTTRALPFALIYVLLWEGVVSSFIQGVDYFSVRGYTLPIMSGINKASFPALEDRVIELPVAIGGAAVVTVVFFLLGVRRPRRMASPDQNLKAI